MFNIHSDRKFDVKNKAQHVNLTVSDQLRGISHNVNVSNCSVYLMVKSSERGRCEGHCIHVTGIKRHVPIIPSIQGPRDTTRHWDTRLSSANNQNNNIETIL